MREQIITAIRRHTLLGAIALGLTLAAQPASAAIMLMTRTVKILGVENGSAGMHERLQNTELKLKIKYDTSKASITTAPGPVPAPTYSEIARLRAGSGGNPFLSGTYELGGVEYNLGIPSQFELDHYAVGPQAGDPDGLFSHAARLTGLADGERGQILSYSMMLIGVGLFDMIPVDFTLPFEGELLEGGEFSFLHSGVDGEEFGDLIFTGDNFLAPGTLKIERLDVAAVPEPATWALMISGFGLSGAALRRRRLTAIA